jgi:hypothetical protein
MNSNSNGNTNRYWSDTAGETKAWEWALRLGAGGSAIQPTRVAVSCSPMQSVATQGGERWWPCVTAVLLSWTARGFEGYSDAEG